jgi:hypothetical protein
MPHPKNRLKLTGDTHLPDIDELLGPDDEVERVTVEVIEVEPVAAMDMPPATAAAAGEQPTGAKGRLAAVEQRIEALPSRSPWLAIAAGLAFGWLVARMLRD